MVIMEAGMATEANLRWLRAQGYRYLVVRRGGQRPFDEDQAVAIQTAGGQTVRLQKDVSEDEQEVQLYGHSLRGCEFFTRLSPRRQNHPARPTRRNMTNSLRKRLLVAHLPDFC
jgi:hypothetical protein